MSSWPDIVTAIVGSAGATGGVSAVLLRLAKNGIKALAKDIADDANKPLLAKIETVETDLSSVKTSLAVQFGGNGGGMREAINTLKVDVAELKGHVAALPTPTAIPVVVPTTGKHESPES